MNCFLMVWHHQIIHIYSLQTNISHGSAARLYQKQKVCATERERKIKSVVFELKL